MVARARALDVVSLRRKVSANLTAAAMHGLPVARADTRAVHTVDVDTRSGAVGGVVRHRGPVPDEDIVEIDGLLCTSLARTVADVARTARAETSVAVADAALRMVAFRSPTQYLTDAAEKLRSEASAIASRAAHGGARAGRVLAFADGNAQLPGESISRLHLVRMGFRRLRIQVPVRAPGGGCYYVDFGLDDVDAFGEFDGDGKYTDPRIMGGRRPHEVVAEEKQREDWIRGTTARRMARWGSQHNRTVDTLRRRLAAFGLTPPR